MAVSSNEKEILGYQAEDLRLPSSCAMQLQRDIRLGGEESLSFPVKTCWRRFDQGFLERRQTALAAFTLQLLTFEDVVRPPRVRSFLGIEQLERRRAAEDNDDL